MPLTQNLLPTNPNTIVLKGKLANRYEEKAAASAISPGMLAEIASNTDTVQPHSTRGGRMQRYIAMEAYFTGGGYPQAGTYTGGTITDAYATNDIVRLHQCQPTDVIYGLLHVGETIVEGDWLISYGDGTFCKLASASLANIVAPSTTITNVAVITAFSNGSVVIPKNTLAADDAIRFRVLVDVPSGNSTDTLVITIKLGTQVIIATTAFDPTNGGGDTVLIDGYIRIRTNGASGTYTADGIWAAGVPGTATVRNFELVSTAIDTTANQTLTVSATWSVASASDQAILEALVVEQVKSGVQNAPAGGAVFGQAAEALDLSAAGANAFIRINVV